MRSVDGDTATRRHGDTATEQLSPRRTFAASLRLVALLLASETLYISLLRFNATNGWRPVLTFLGILGALFAMYALSAVVVRQANDDRRLLFLIVTGAVLFRVTLLPAGLPHDSTWAEMFDNLRADVRGEAVVYERFQLYDDDLWRYLWDGHVQASGVNPYQFAPTNESLDALAENSETWTAIREAINYAETPTIYPPLAQLIFRFAHALAPGSVLTLKMVIVLFDLLAIVFLVLTLRALQQPLALMILYAWNPLVIKVFAGSGHVDAALVAALAATMYFIVRRQRAAAAISFGLAVLAKLSPLVLLPFVLKRTGWRHAVTIAMVVLLGYLPFISAGSALFAGFRQFAREWQFNAGPFLFVQWLMSFVVSDPATMARAICGLSIVVFILWLMRQDDGREVSFGHFAALALGALLLLSPAVMPWYVTWVLPQAIVAGSIQRRLWSQFSALVCLAFLVMVDERERAWALWLEYGMLAALMLNEWRRATAQPQMTAVATESTI